jgi:hypothetical protein
MRGNSMRENRETHGTPPPNVGGGRSGKAAPKPDMYVPWESDVSIVPAKRANKVGAPMAESVEERETPKGNAGSTLLVPDTGPGTCEASEEPAYGR